MAPPSLKWPNLHPNLHFALARRCRSLDNNQTPNSKPINIRGQATYRNANHPQSSANYARALSQITCTSNLASRRTRRATYVKCVPLTSPPLTATHTQKRDSDNRRLAASGVAVRSLLVQFEWGPHSGACCAAKRYARQIHTRTHKFTHKYSGALRARALTLSGGLTEEPAAAEHG